MCWAKDNRKKGGVVSIVSLIHIRTKITRKEGGMERKEKKQTKQKNKNEMKITTILIIIIIIIKGKRNGNGGGMKE